MVTDPAERAMLEFAEKMTIDATQITKEDVDKLREAGFSDSDILDITLCAAYRTFINKVADALGIELNKETNPDPKMVETLSFKLG